MRTETVVEIDAPASTVWAVVANVEAWPEWTPTMREVTLRGGGPLGPGSVADIRQPKLPKATWTVTGYEEGHAFTWVGAGPGVRTVADHRVEPLGADRCRVTLSVETTGPLARPFWLLLGGLTERYVATEAASLKADVESA
jgi:uncharacterized membrane protein